MATVRVNCGNGVWIEVEAASVKDAVAQVSAYQEVFGERACGLCSDATALRWEHRSHGGHDYYSVVCAACGGQLDYGQHKSGATLFAKRSAHEATRGWHRRPRQLAAVPPSSSRRAS